jgi:H+-translocating NAD(P) transhydrogenase subunit alpha
MKLSVPKETKFKENRVALTPEVVKGLVKKGFDVLVEQGAGLNSFYADEVYTAAGATIVDSAKCYSDADVVLKVNAPQPDEISKMKKEAISCLPQQTLSLLKHVPKQAFQLFQWMLYRAFPVLKRWMLFLHKQTWQDIKQ